MEKQVKPLLSILEEILAKDRLIMHMPGHKAGRLFSEQFKSHLLQYDLTELPGLDNLHRARGVLADSMKACAKAFGARESFFLVNGSTSGIHAMLAASLNKGDKLIVVRNCHISVINALILFGIHPVFIMPRYDEQWQMVLPPSIESWRKTLDENPDVKGALVTSPDYYGLCTPLEELACLLHEREKFLLVDEAHGAHFAFSCHLPQTALQQGADACVQSFHKTMPALTQTAVLHLGTDRICCDRLKRCISMLTTTSPSYMLMASMEYACDFASREGQESYERLIGALNEMKTELADMDKLRLVPDSLCGFQRDATRIVVDTSQTTFSGYHFSSILEHDYDIIAEMADETHVVFIVTPADTTEELHTVIKALKELDKKVMPCNPKAGIRPFEVQPGRCEIPSLSDYLGNVAYIPIESSIGFVSVSMVTPYPPGVPLLCPGETITENIIAQVQKLMHCGCELQGLTGNNGLIAVLDQRHENRPAQG
ncbi:MAG: aminotransferase class I/II-fold pyridoxal phosphate-dependent enzyme [Thermoclostridium sp.]|nr:aminotransferase class I/II-fold pyridoxal phosphate-dependent enzyme [Thermoclostridium sp.]